MRLAAARTHVTAAHTEAGKLPYGAQGKARHDN